VKATPEAAKDVAHAVGDAVKKTPEVVASGAKK